MKPPKVVAEIGQANGDPAYVKSAIAAAARAGCWGVKLQLLQPERIAQEGAELYWDDKRILADQRESFARSGHFSYNPDELATLVDYADEHGVELFATPFDHDAVVCMAKAGMRWCKIASGDLTNEPLVRHAAQSFPTRLIVSTGAATLGEIDRAVGWIDEASGEDPAFLLACSLVYPTPDAEAEIARVPVLRRRYGHLAAEVGYSDHTYMAGAAYVAVAAGARMLEKHVTLQPNNVEVPDNEFALTPGLLKMYVANAEQAARMMGTGTIEPTAAEQAARTGARRSVCAARPLPAGTVVSPGDLVMLRPWVDGGLSPAEAWKVIGRRLRQAVAEGAPVLQADVST